MSSSQEYALIIGRILYNSIDRSLYEFVYTEPKGSHHICRLCKLRLFKNDKYRLHCNICVNILGELPKDGLISSLSTDRIFLAGEPEMSSNISDNIFLNPNYSFQPRSSLYISRYFKRSMRP